MSNALESLPAPAWGGICAVLASVVTSAVALVSGRRTGRVADSDSLRQDNRYLAERLAFERNEKERLYGLNQELHNQISRLLDVTDATLARAAAQRERVEQLLGTSSGAGHDAAATVE